MATTTYTDHERQTLRTAAFGAVYLVSSAEPGLLDMVKESFAGSSDALDRVANAAVGGTSPKEAAAAAKVKAAIGAAG